MGDVMDSLKVLCPCGYELGEFAPYDDNNAVVMKCPSCRQFVEIHNGDLGEVLDNPEDYEPNDRITACLVEGGD